MVGGSSGGGWGGDGEDGGEGEGVGGGAGGVGALVEVRVWGVSWWCGVDGRVGGLGVGVDGLVEGGEDHWGVKWAGGKGWDYWRMS